MNNSAMLSPTRSAQTKGSSHGSSQYAPAEDVQGTAMSVAGVPTMPENVAIETATLASGVRTMPGSTTTVSSKSPNAVFQKNQSRGH